MALVHGRECSITIKTAYRGIRLPYSEETIREAVSILKEEAPIEGDGICRGLCKSDGVTGCVVTPLSIGTTPLLLGLCLGVMEMPVYVSETRNLYRHEALMAPSEDGAVFNLIQDRGGVRKIYEGCRVTGFELRIMGEEESRPLSLKMDIAGDIPAVAYPYAEIAETDRGERFKADGVTYKVNEVEDKDIYGLRIVATKDGGARTEVWIHRMLRPGLDIAPVIEGLTLIAQVKRDKYECKSFGLFRLHLERLLLMSDEMAVDSAGPVIGPLRYYVAGKVMASVFTNNDGGII
ncbi:hypothetical protein AGMMS49587_15250 [Spirochaetia bacterium]|nr:hypothetical protein AGMMS49587_15250 [Spirochaetia bacterium]